MTVLLSSFFLIFLAELADKTMLITLSLSSKYRRSKVLVGIFLASVFVMVIPVLLGDYLLKFFPRGSMLLIAGLLFIGIGILNLLERDSDEESKMLSWKLPPILLVFLLFLISEMGDKTQITAFSISVSSGRFWEVWVGSTLGLFLPNLVAAFFGSLVMSKVPERIRKYTISGLFTIVGVFLLVQYFA